METIREFTTRYLRKYVVASDVQIIDAFVRKYYIRPFKSVNYGMICKKWESIRKVLSYMKNDKVLWVKNRIEHPCKNTKGRLCSEEIFYYMK